MARKIRLDVHLLTKGFVESRQMAQRLIRAGKVKKINGELLDKPGQLVEESLEIIISEKPRFVSRGGDKLQFANEIFQISFENRVCLDIGVSTGGFTDCLLQNGASLVYSIDVGYGQTAWEIRQNPKVVLIERTNIRKTSEEDIFKANDLRPDCFVVDVSFISLTMVLKSIINLLEGEDLEGIVLIKPQFEVGKYQVSKGGVVNDPKSHLFVLEKIIDFCIGLDWAVNDLIPSPLVGPAGNHEYLLWISKNKKVEKKLDLREIVKSVLN
tara:strand:- start:30130 stop:30936 length:807 start_codon:yes stop_codon:yes gene_type:complete